MEKVRDPISHVEMQDINSTGKLNWLRAAVLGANDGIVSVSSVIVGVAGASSNLRYILTAGVAAMVAGALSMSAGEYVSVSTQRDSEEASFARNPQGSIDQSSLTNPWQAAYASATAFFSGAIIPIVATIITPEHFRVPAVFASVVVALIITGALSAHTGGSKKTRAVIRVVSGGVIAMLITYGVGKLFGVSGI